jgi:hypothetical protein
MPLLACFKLVQQFLSGAKTIIEFTPRQRINAEERKNLMGKFDSLTF